jgi:hypothetical protein
MSQATDHRYGSIEKDGQVFAIRICLQISV